MIINKQLPEDPDYYNDWDNFEKVFPEEAIFICGKFVNICKTQKIILGKPTLMDILNKTIPAKFPNLKNNFKLKFPNKNMDAVLGIGLWKTIDLDNDSWKWEIYEGKKYIKV
jgi:hypothetical protein